MILKEYNVWDAPTRIFHWVNFTTVVLLIFMGLIMLFKKDLGITSLEAKIALKEIHVLIGYLFVLNLTWRIVWGFIGNRYSRWSVILPGRGFSTELKNYLGSIKAGEPKQYLGHNPLGRLAVTVFISLLLVMAVTGLVRAGTDIYFPPFGSIAAKYVAKEEVDPASIRPYDKTGVAPDKYKDLGAFKKPYGTLHIYTAYLLMFLILLHIFVVACTEIKEGGGLVSAMFSGRKTLRQEPEDLQD